jgi:hypothetical protein
MKSKFLATRIALATGLTLSAATVMAEGTPTSEKVQAKVYELLDKDIATVKFASGSTAITESERSSLRAFVTAAKANGKVDKFIVAAWSDEEMPQGDDKLSEKQQNLAKDRNHAVKQALKDAGADDVDTFSMAERANWIQKTFNTEGAQLKGAGKIKDAEERVTAQIGDRLRSKGGPGTAVIVAKYDVSAAAH